MDTTVLIDHLRGHDGARSWLDELDVVPLCSEVSRVEVLVGVPPSRAGETEALFRTLEWIPVDEPIARRAGDLGSLYGRSHGMGIADLLIGATAQDRGALLATGNVRHFPMFAGLEAPY